MILNTNESSFTLSRKIVQCAVEQAGACDKTSPHAILGQVIQRVLDHELIDDELRYWLIKAIADELGCDTEEDVG